MVLCRQTLPVQTIAIRPFVHRPLGTSVSDIVSGDGSVAGGKGRMFVGSIVGFTGGKDVSPWRPLHAAPEADHQRVLLGRSIGRVVADAAVAHRPGLRLKGKVGVCD